MTEQERETGRARETAQDTETWNRESGLIKLNQEHRDKGGRGKSHERERERSSDQVGRKDIERQGVKQKQSAGTHTQSNTQRQRAAHPQQPAMLFCDNVAHHNVVAGEDSQQRIYY